MLTREQVKFSRPTERSLTIAVTILDIISCVTVTYRHLEPLQMKSMGFTRCNMNNLDLNAAPGTNLLQSVLTFIVVRVKIGQYSLVNMGLLWVNKIIL